MKVCNIIELQIQSYQFIVKIIVFSSFINGIQITFSQVYSDLEVAFIISEEEAIFKALSKTVELLEGVTAPISQYYYGCLFHELLSFQLADRRPPAEVCQSLNYFLRSFPLNAFGYLIL